MRPASSRRLVAALSVLCLGALAACGGDDDAAGPPSDPPPTTDAVAPGGRDAAPASTAAAASTAAPVTDGAFPVTIEHQYGETTIAARPERVVSVGFTDQDTLLALGVVPVGVREWYGEQPFATWPWAADELGDAEPAVLPSAELDFESIAALDPDLIVGLSSGMTPEDYDLLSAIAPTLAQSGDHIAFGMPWQEATVVTGQALGLAEEAQALVDQTEAQLAAVAADHPDWAGQEVAVAYVLSDAEIGAYASGDARPQLLAELGFVTPAEFDDLAGDQFYSSFSYEEIDRLDRDVLMWIAAEPAVIAQIEANPLRDGLGAVADGREVFLGQLEAGAFSFSSVLSIPYLLERLVPQLEAATDGDPATVVEQGDA